MIYFYKEQNLPIFFFFFGGGGGGWNGRGSSVATG